MQFLMVKMWLDDWLDLMHLGRLQSGGGGGGSGGCCQTHDLLLHLHHRNSSLVVTGVSDSCLLSWSANTLTISCYLTVVDSQPDRGRGREGGNGGDGDGGAASLPSGCLLCVAAAAAACHRGWMVVVRWSRMDRFSNGLLKMYLFIFASLQDRSPLLPVQWALVNILRLKCLFSTSYS